MDYAKEIHVEKDDDASKDYKRSTELSLDNEVKTSEHCNKGKSGFEKDNVRHPSVIKNQ